METGVMSEKKNREKGIFQVLMIEDLGTKLHGLGMEYLIH